MNNKLIENNISQMLPRQDENGRFRGLILSGRGGIGKTALAMNLIPDAKVIRISMAQKSFENFGTYPIPIKTEIETDSGTTQEVELKNVVIENELLQLSIDSLGTDYAVFLLDDVTLGDERLQSSILELVQFGRIGDVTLGINVLPVITGNGVQDGCFAIEWSKALLGRCNLIHYEPDFERWIALSCNDYLEPSVVAFLKDHPHFFSPEATNDKAVDQHGKAPCPRDWTSLGGFFHDIGGFTDYRANLLYANAGAFCRASVGEKAGTAYASYAKTFGIYPTSKQLFESPTLWKNVSSEKRSILSGAMGVAFGLRSLAKTELKILNANNKNSRVAKKRIIEKLCDAIKIISEDHREIVAFVFTHMLHWACDEDITSGGLISEVLYSESVTNDGFKTLLEGFKAFNQSKTAL